MPVQKTVWKCEWCEVMGVSHDDIRRHEGEDHDTGWSVRGEGPTHALVKPTFGTVATFYYRNHAQTTADMFNFLNKYELTVEDLNELMGLLHAWRITRMEGGKLWSDETSRLYAFIKERKIK